MKKKYTRIAKAIRATEDAFDVSVNHETRIYVLWELMAKKGPIKDRVIIHTRVVFFRLSFLVFHNSRCFRVPKIILKNI